MYLKILATALSAPVAFAALASNTGLSFTPEKISTEIDFGTLSGKAKERVYLPEEKGRKASQLDWKYSNAPIVKGHLTGICYPEYLSVPQGGQH